MKIELSKVPEVTGSKYPKPYDQPCNSRRSKRLGDAAGLTQFGVNLVTLPPGAWSSQRHWHSREDELAYVVSGEVTLVMDEGEEGMRAGDCVGWKGGVRNGHMLRNDSSADAVILVVGGRDDEDWGEYSDVDMMFHAGRYTSPRVNTRKDGSAI